VFSERFDPIFFSNLSYNHRTKIGSIIPRINFSNRSGNSGLQYEIDFYPKFLKRFYAYLNYGYSNTTVYPSHKAGGDIYVNLPGAFEFSAGGRYIVTQTQNVTALTNSIGHYRGNYYFSLRSFINPRPGNLTRISANFLTRKYFKDAENFIGINFGVGYSPELRQIIAGDVLLAETLLFIESQRLSLEYQFTSKNSQNIYRTRIGVRRQELAFDSGNFFWGITAGLNYQVKL
jgi:YaiO family outer membrane protein